MIGGWCKNPICGLSPLQENEWALFLDPGKKYFVQTPNLYFPIEPHFLFPFFQFLPIDNKVWLFTHFSMGWYPKIANKQEARRLATQTKLLSKKQLMNLFPEANLYEEKIFGLTKSLIVYYGW